MTKNISIKALLLALFVAVLGLTLNTVPVLAKQITRVRAPIPAITATANFSNISKNWSGYNATGGTYTGVGGTWIVPNSDSNGLGFSADATWVGIGGVSSTNLIQAGTQTILTNGTTSYQAWYELLPTSSRKIPLTVNPGDSITISITNQSGNTWNISFLNNTSGKNYQTSVTYYSSLSSAEWIEEAPSMGRSIIPLDNFGSVHFSDLWTIKNGVKVNPSETNATPVSMANPLGQILAQSSVLGNDGASFTINRTASTSQVAAAYYSGIGRQRISTNIRGFQSSYGYRHYRGNFSGVF